VNAKDHVFILREERVVILVAPPLTVRRARPQLHEIADIDPLRGGNTAKTIDTEMELMRGVSRTTP
jgi:hypothetical protein